MSRQRKIASHYILTPSGLCPGGLITIDTGGRIAAVETGVEDIDARPGVEFYAGILIPGMVNAHCHLELSFAAGKIEQGCGFAGFARGLGAARQAVGEGDKQRCIEYQDCRMWSEGISAVGDISNLTDSFGVKSKSRIIYHTFVEAYGLRRTSLEEFRAVERAARQMDLAAGLTPHSTYSLNETLFREAVESSDGILSIHFMESGGERELFEGRGEMAQWYREAGFETDFTTKYRSPAERVIANVPRERKVMLVHNTCVNKEEIEMLNAHFGANLTWVLCPRSNRFITGELPPVELLRKSGARIAIGTDSLASNHSLSVLEEIKMFPEVPLEQLLWWATINGALALSVDDRLGSFESGKTPGVVLVEGVDMKNMRLTEHTTCRKLV